MLNAANISSKWTFLAFFAIFQLGSLICGVATTSTMLIVGRAVAGLGSAGLQNGVLTILAGAVPLHKRPRKHGKPPLYDIIHCGLADVHDCTVYTGILLGRK